MSKKGLTAKQVEHMKAGEKRLEVAAGAPTGLYLVVHPTGKKSWMFRYRYRGRTRGLTLSKPYPDIGLAAARAEAQAAVDSLENDIDPAAVQAVEIEEAKPHSVKAVAEEWLTRYVKPNTRERTAREFKRILHKEVIAVWKDKLITEITRPDVLRLLDAIADRPAPILANKTLAILKSWMSWTLERGYLDASPAHAIKPPSKAKSRDRVLTPPELTEVLAAADTLGYPTGPFVRFLALVAQRRTEAATMRWRDVDLEKALWTLPKEATKAGRVHDVPLSPPAVALLKSLPRFKAGDYIFTTTSGEKPINGFSKAKTQLDTKILERRKTALADWTMHDIRRTAATQMAKAGVPPHVLAAILNHTPGSTQGVTSIYNRFRYTEERRAALQAWADYVLSLEKKPVIQKTAIA